MVFWTAVYDPWTMSRNCISLRTLGSSIGLNKIELKKRMHWKHRWKQKNKKDIEILDAYKPKPERFLALGKPSQLIEKQQLVQHITSKYKHLIKQIQVLVYLPYLESKTWLTLKRNNKKNETNVTLDQCFHFQGFYPVLGFFDSCFWNLGF